MCSGSSRVRGAACTCSSRWVARRGRRGVRSCRRPARDRRTGDRRPVDPCPRRLRRHRPRRWQGRADSRSAGTGRRRAPQRCAGPAGPQTRRRETPEGGREGQLHRVQRRRTAYALASQQVAHVEMVEHITPVPNAADVIDGVVFSRGEIVPALNLRARFGFPRIACDLRTRLLVVRHDGRTAGLLVDAAREFMAIPAAAIHPPNEGLRGMSGRYLSGIATIGDRMVLILDLAERPRGSAPPPTGRSATRTSRRRSTPQRWPASACHGTLRASLADRTSGLPAAICTSPPRTSAGSSAGPPLRWPMLSALRCQLSKQGQIAGHGQPNPAGQGKPGRVAPVRPGRKDRPGVHLAGGRRQCIGSARPWRRPWK